MIDFIDYMIKCADKGFSPKIVGGWGGEKYDSCVKFIINEGDREVIFHKTCDGKNRLVSYDLS